MSAYRVAGRTSAALLRVALYLAAVLTPLALAYAQQPSSDHPFFQELAKSAALVGYTIAALQFILAGRFRWIERPFGLDAVCAFHRRMGAFAGTLLLLHPVLYAAGGEWGMLFGLDHGWAISLGKVGFVAAALLGVSSLFRRTLSLDFETWRGVHNGLAVSVLLLGFVHGLFAGGDFGEWPMRALWMVLFGAAVAGYARHRLLVPRRLRRDDFLVTDVRCETPDVTSLEMAPLRDGRSISQLPGQFVFLTLSRTDHYSGEEHPFTVASSPDPSGRLTITIKASGDFSAAVADTRVGDRATVQGGYGRFSHVLHPAEIDLVFIAGGVGVTPFLSMLRHMRAEQSKINVLLVYGSRGEQDIVARRELDEIASCSAPSLTTALVLSDPQDDWAGLCGRIDGPMLEQLVPEVQGRTFYVSGPPAMIRDVTAELRRRGVPRASVRCEQFAL